MLPAGGKAIAKLRGEAYFLLQTLNAVIRVGVQLPDGQTRILKIRTLKKWIMTMLAEIFLLKLEAILRVAAIDLRAASGDPRFVPVALPRS